MSDYTPAEILARLDPATWEQPVCQSCAHGDHEQPLQRPADCGCQCHGA